MMLRQRRSVSLTPSRRAARLSNALSWLPLARYSWMSSSTRCRFDLCAMAWFQGFLYLLKYLVPEGANTLPWSSDRKEAHVASEMRIELIQVPVSDVDRAKAFYVEKVGFSADHDHQVSDELRFVQLTPPGSSCSIALTSGAHQM